MRRKLLKVDCIRFTAALMLLLMAVVLFTAKPVEAGWPGKTFTLTVDVSLGGIVTVNQTAPSSYPAKYTFEDGTRVLLEAVPDHRFLFNNWSGDLTGTANPSIIVISCNQNVTANFSPNKPLLAEFLGITALIGFLLIASIIVKRR